MRNPLKSDRRSKNKDHGHPICKHCQKESLKVQGWLLCKQCATTEVGSMYDDSFEENFNDNQTGFNNFTVTRLFKDGKVKEEHKL